MRVQGAVRRPSSRDIADGSLQRSIRQDWRVAISAAATPRAQDDWDL